MLANQLANRLLAIWQIPLPCGSYRRPNLVLTVLESERACFCDVLGCTVLDSALRTDGRAPSVSALGPKTAQEGRESRGPGPKTSQEGRRAKSLVP